MVGEAEVEIQDFFVSEAVLEEVGRGDAEAANRRLAAIRGLDLLAIDEDAIRLTEKLLQAGVIPAKAAADAIHRGCGPTRDRLSAYMELSAHRECGNHPPPRLYHRARRLTGAGALHTKGTFWR